MVALPLESPGEGFSKSCAGRWADLRYVRSLLPHDAVGMCCRFPSLAGSSDVSVDVCRREAAGGNVSAFYRGLHTCKSVWTCPICSARISEARTHELHQMIEHAEEMGYRPLLVTLTFSHHAYDQLADLLPAFTKALSRARTGGGWSRVRQEFRPLGAVRSIEVTHGENGWHPHAHELWFLPADVDVDAFAAAYRKQWMRALEHAGLSGTEDRAFKANAARASIAAYLQKWGRQPRWGPGRELTKGAQKVAGSEHRSPWQLLTAAREGDERARRLFLEYAAAFKGRRQLFYSPGLRAALALPEPVSDAEAADSEVAPEEVKVVVTLDAGQVSRVVHNRVEHEVLIIAARGTAAEVLAYIAGLPAPRIGLQGPALDEWKKRKDKPAPVYVPRDPDASTRYTAGLAYSDEEMAIDG